MTLPCAVGIGAEFACGQTAASRDDGRSSSDMRSETLINLMAAFGKSRVDSAGANFRVQIESRSLGFRLSK